jgi:hypothetical protein
MKHKKTKASSDPKIWTKDFIEELNRRTRDFESGKSKGHTWEEVKASLKQKSPIFGRKS